MIRAHDLNTTDNQTESVKCAIWAAHHAVAVLPVGTFNVFMRCCLVYRCAATPKDVDILASIEAQSFPEAEMAYCESFEKRLWSFPDCFLDPF